MQTRLKLIGNRVARYLPGMAAVALLTCGVAIAQDVPPDGGEGSRQPIIIPNQFDTTSSGALNARRPGLLIEQAIAFNQGASNSLSGEIPANTGFVEETTLMVAQGLLDFFKTLLTSIPQLLNLLLGVNSGLGGLTGGLGSGSSFIPIPGSITGGQGSSASIQ